MSYQNQIPPNAPIGNNLPINPIIPNPNNPMPPSPQQPPQPLPPQPISPQVQVPNTSHQNKKVLLIEDDVFIGGLLQLKLEQSGFEVERALDGEQGFEMIESFQPEIILLDLILPKRSGFELLEMMKQDPRFSKIPVIITSNLGQDSDVERGKTFGVIEYIVKNKLSLEDLVTKVKEEIKKIN